MSATMDRRRAAPAAKIDAAVDAADAADRPVKLDTKARSEPATSIEMIDPRHNRCRLVAATPQALDALIRSKLAAGWSMVP